MGAWASVAPAVGLAPIARGAGVLCVNINFDPNADPHASFHESVLGDAHVVLAQWAASLSSGQTYERRPTEQIRGPLIVLT